MHLAQFCKLVRVEKSGDYRSKFVTFIDDQQIYFKWLFPLKIQHSILEYIQFHNLIWAIHVGL